MLCRRCKRRQVPPRQGGRPGRPRTTCLTCEPYDPPATEEEAERRREFVRASHARRKAGGNYATSLCGCDRDYLTVPLEDAHRCPYPRPIPREREPDADDLGLGQGVYNGRRYPWRE